MKQCVVWLILLQLCNSQYVDYSDYQPMGLPLRNSIGIQSKNQSPESNEYIKSLDSDNWQSPISYLKKRGYMPATDDGNSVEASMLEHEEEKENHLSDKSNLISPEHANPCLDNNCLPLMEIDQPAGDTVGSKDKSEPQVNDSKPQKTGIISKVKNKFLSLFSSRSSNQSDESHNEEKTDFSGGEYEQDEFDGHDKPSTAHQDDGLFKKLTEADIMFIKNFIKCFKNSRKEYEIELGNGSNGNGTRPNAGNTTRNFSSTEPFKKLSSSTESCDVQTTPKSIIQSSTKFVDGYGRLTTPKTIDLGAKDEADEITVDLDISQKNGTGQVILGGTKMTECAPLRLKDMSFDLEWNKNNKPFEVGRDGTDDVDGSFQRNHQDQSLAAKFLKDVNSDTPRNEEHLRTPYSDNFLDSQQKVPDESDKPPKVSAKREVPFKSGRRCKVTKHLSDTASLLNTEIDDDYNYEMSDKYGPKRTTRWKAKTRSRKRPKHKPRNRPDLHESDLESVEDEDDGETKNIYHSFGELNDVQFRVSPDDEEAISKFIANLNSPPELFSFDVDQYLRSSEMENEPQTSKFQAPEARPFYDFLDGEKEKVPLIENPAPEDDEQRDKMADKRDLLRQYIKGVSNALSTHKYPENGGLLVTANVDDSSQRRSFANTNWPVDRRYIPSLDSNSGYTKPGRDDEFLDNYYLLNDGSAQIFDLDRHDSDALGAGKYSLNSDTDKKLRDRGLRSSLEDDKIKEEAPGREGKVDIMLAEDGRHVQDKDPELSDENS